MEASKGHPEPCKVGRQVRRGFQHHQERHGPPKRMKWVEALQGLGTLAQPTSMSRGNPPQGAGGKPSLQYNQDQRRQKIFFSCLEEGTMGPSRTYGFLWETAAALQNSTIWCLVNQCLSFGTIFILQYLANVKFSAANKAIIKKSILHSDIYSYPMNTIT